VPIERKMSLYFLLLAAGGNRGIFLYSMSVGIHVRDTYEKGITSLKIAYGA